MGQMLRGGRSWPSDRNVGAGAAKCGKVAEPVASGNAIVGGAVISSVAEHEDAQCRNFSAALCPWSCRCDWSCVCVLAISWEWPEVDIPA